MKEIIVLRDQRDRSFYLEGDVAKISHYLGFNGCEDSFDIEERLKEEDDGEAGYYIEGVRSK